MTATEVAKAWRWDSPHRRTKRGTKIIPPPPPKKPLAIPAAPPAMMGASQDLFFFSMGLMFGLGFEDQSNQQTEENGRSDATGCGGYAAGKGSKETCFFNGLSHAFG